MGQWAYVYEATNIIWHAQPRIMEGEQGYGDL